jgi:hypothetical protein
MQMKRETPSDPSIDGIRLRISDDDYQCDTCNKKIIRSNTNTHKSRPNGNALAFS